MTIYSIPPLVTSLVTLTVGLLVLIRGKKPTYTFVTLSVFAWLFCYAFMYSTGNYDLALKLARISYIGVIFIPVFSYHFVVAFLNLRNKKRAVTLNYVIGLIFMGMIWNKNFISGLYRYYWGFQTRVGFLHNLFLAYFLVIMLSVIYELHIAFKKAKMENLPLETTRIKYVMLSFMISIFAATDFLPKYGIEWYPVGFVCITLHAIATTYAIVRYRLLDVNVVITRATIFFVVYFTVLGIPFAIGYRLLGRGLWYIPLFIGVVLASAGPFIYTYLQRKAENRLLQDQVRYQKALLHASEGMLLIKDLQRVSSLTAHLLTRTIGLSYACVYLHDAETNQYLLRAKRERRQACILDEVSHTSLIVEWLNKNRRPILYEEATFSSHQSFNIDIADEMKRIGASVIVPSFVQDKLIAFFIMGSKLSGAMFSSNDIAVFQVLANQAALAIENAIFYEETRKTLAQQFHEHRLRSIGKMGSYMGHQINNRFHAILTRAEEALLLALKKIDRNNLSDEQRRLIEKAEGSLNYIKEEAARGGSITQRLTAFSRKETKFKPNDIHEVISATLELLSCKFNTEELNLKIEIENRDYKIYGDMAQLQDIFFNLLDNAHDAEQQKKKENENYVPRTLIRGYIENSSWHIELTDNGTGMTQEHLEQLFLPFFTTKATSEKGTGIGLAVIKSMIESQNGGISAKSKYGEGTTFYIIIPAVKGEE